MDQVTASHPNPLDYLLPRTIKADDVKTSYGKKWWLRCGGVLLPVTEAGSSRAVIGHRLIVAKGEVGSPTAQLKIELHVKPEQLLDLEEFDQPAFLVEKTARILADADSPVIKWESLQQEDRDRWLRMAKAVAPIESHGWYDFPEVYAPVADKVKR